MCNSNKPTPTCSRTRRQQIADPSDRTTSRTTPTHQLSAELPGAGEGGGVTIALEADRSDTTSSRTRRALDRSTQSTQSPPPSASSKRRRRPLRRYRPSASLPLHNSSSAVVFASHENESAFERKRRVHQTRHFTIVAEELLQLLPMMIARDPND